MPGPAVINSFTANIYLILKGQSVTLSWNTSFAFSVTLNGADVALSGSRGFTQQVTTTYTLKAIGDAGSATRSLTVVVAGAPAPPIPPPTPPPPGPPQIICTPGALKCIGPDLYVCNTAGTAWILKTANSPTCKAAGGTPDFGTDPVGWVIGTITKAWEAMLGFVSGQFNIFLQNIKSFQNNFMAQLAVFIQDPLKSLRSWLDGVYAGISAITGEITKGISSWWASTSSAVVSWINSAVDGVRSWFNDQIGILQRGWNNIVSGVQTWFNDQIEILQRGWDAVTSGLSKWVTDQLGILQRGWDATFAQIPTLIAGAVDGLKTWVEGFVAGFAEAAAEAFFGGLTKGINEAGHSPLDVEKPTDNPALKGLQTYMINYRKERDKKKVK